MALAAINVEKNARSANMELLHRKSSSQNVTGQQYKFYAFHTQVRKKFKLKVIVAVAGKSL